MESVKNSPKEPMIGNETITTTNAYKHFTRNQLKYIIQIYKENYKLGFLNGQKSMRLAVMLLLFTSLSFCQSGIIASGNDNYTVGAGLVELQIPVIKQGTLSVPKFELPAETPVQKPIVKPKKKSLMQSVIDFIKKLINKNK